MYICIYIYIYTYMYILQQAAACCRMSDAGANVARELSCVVDVRSICHGTRLSSRPFMNLSRHDLQCSVMPSVESWTNAHACV